MTRATFTFTLTLLACLGIGAACDRTHLSPTFGRATRAAFAQQVIDPVAGNRDGGVGGLDPQEAAIVADAYRKTLSPKGSDDAARRAPVLVVPQQQGGNQQP